MHSRGGVHPSCTPQEGRTLDALLGGRRAPWWGRLRWTGTPPSTSCPCSAAPETSWSPGRSGRCAPPWAAPGNLRREAVCLVKGRLLCLYGNQSVYQSMRFTQPKELLTPRPHRCASASHAAFFDILHHAPAHGWGWNPSTIVVVHKHLSVNTTIWRPFFVRCDLGVCVRWRTRCGRGVREGLPFRVRVESHFALAGRH